VLEPNGLLVFEVQHLGDLLAGLQYDFVYHEHLLYHSLGPLDRILETTGFFPIHVERVRSHSGSIRVFAAKAAAGKGPGAGSVGDLRQSEERAGLYSAATFADFAAAVGQHRAALRNLLCGLKAQGFRVAGYGASGRASMLTNLCGLGPDLVEYIVDESPSG